MSTRTTVGLVQISEVMWERRISRQFRVVSGVLVPRRNPRGLTTALGFLPHAAGLLQAYVQRHAPEPNQYKFLRPIHTRVAVDEAVEHLRGADVVGFSTYVWNGQLSLAIARALKVVRPDVVVVFGGPQAPDDARVFLGEHPYVDLVCHGEGERTFLEILENREGRHWDDVASISFLGEGGRFVRTPPRPRMSDLDEVPSPYLTGVFDELMEANAGQSWLVTWETNRGCPFSCTCCDWGSATASKIARYGMGRLEQELEWFASHRVNHLFVCDANFGILPRDVEIAERIAEAWERHDASVTVGIQNTKNRTERSEQIHRILRRCRSVSIGANVSLQTVSPESLKAIRRDNISRAGLERMQKFFAEEGRDCYTELIIGLAGETYASFADGVAQVIGNGQYNRILFYECTLLPNAPMSQPDYRREHALEHVAQRIVHAYEPLGWGGREEIPEYIDMVVGTRTMDRDDWVRARVFSDIVSLLFFDRILQLPMMVLGSSLGLNYRRMFEAFVDVDADEFPIVGAVSRYFADHARAMQRGASQYIPSPEWLNIWWPVDQYVLIGLARAEQLDDLYRESREILIRFAEREGADLDPVLLDDALRLNRAMFSLPFQWNDEVVELSYAVDQFYHELVAGHSSVLERRTCRILIERGATVWLSWDDWCEDLMHRAYLRRGYVSPATRLSDQAPSVSTPVLSEAVHA